MKEQAHLELGLKYVLHKDKSCPAYDWFESEAIREVYRKKLIADGYKPKKVNYSKLHLAVTSPR